jgi:hypothetical protein
MLKGAGGRKDLGTLGRRDHGLLTQANEECRMMNAEITNLKAERLKD